MRTFLVITPGNSKRTTSTGRPTRTTARARPHQIEEPLEAIRAAACLKDPVGAPAFGREVDSGGKGGFSDVQ